MTILLYTIFIWIFQRDVIYVHNGVIRLWKLTGVCKCALNSSDVAWYLNFSILEPCVFFYSYLYLLNQMFYMTFLVQCVISPSLSLLLLSFFFATLSLSLLQAGCSSGTQIRSTLPFGWPFFFTTQALMHQRPPLTWYPTWTTLRLPTASLLPMPVSSTWSCILDIYINAVLAREIEKVH